MSERDEVLARAVLYRWAARLFFYPDEATLQALAGGAAQTEMAAAVAALPRREALTTALAEVQAASAALEHEEPGLAGEHTHLFARSVRCPPYESSYAGERAPLRTHDLAEIAGFYAVFGVQVSEERRELPDHVSLELEFLSYLCAKEVYALEHGWRREAGLCRAGRGRFLREHLGQWFPAFAERLTQYARLRFYPAAAGLTQALLEADPMAAPASCSDADPVLLGGSCADVIDTSP
ncbi:MAG: molecular chaperone TorD family protein [Chloroflexi bacterium]|nr:molecular chaperone TorD family protein [Chloroflexota bacterium]